MKNFISAYLLKFALSATILVIIFRYFLGYGLENNSHTIIILSSVFYTVGMFAAGWYFGKKDGNYLPIYDVGFRFHCTTYLVHNTISILWTILKITTCYQKIESLIFTVFFWGFLLFIHFIFFLIARKRSFKGLNKSDLFE
jgi:hypothetical protein